MSFQVQANSTIPGPLSSVRIGGVQQSKIHVNLHGPPWTALARNAGWPDYNPFGSEYVSVSLLEVSLFGNQSVVPSGLIRPVVEALNVVGPYFTNSESGLIGFWPLSVNATNGATYANPASLNELVDVVVAAGTAVGAKTNIVLPNPEGADGYYDFFGGFAWGCFTAVDRECLSIPPDSDDDFGFMGIGGLLRRQNKKYGAEYNQWKASVAPVSVHTEALLKYAYRPFSDTFDFNSIEPRSFFAIKEYLWTRQAQLGPSSPLLQRIALPNTWYTNYTRDSYMAATWGGEYSYLAFNQLDFTVAADVLSALTALMIADPETPGDKTSGQLMCEATDPLNVYTPVWWSDPVDAGPNDIALSVRDMYASTADMLSFFVGDINSVVYKRWDLSNLFYPALQTFFWLSSRTLFYLTSQSHMLNAQGGPCLLPPVMEVARLQLAKAYRTGASDWLVSNQTKEGFWYAFLGRPEDHVLGMPVGIYQDRLYSTAMAVNALLNIWTFGKQDGSLGIAESMPRRVKDAIKKGAQWLYDNAIERSLVPPFDFLENPFNAFFSADVKTNVSNPYLYPYNFRANVTEAEGSTSWRKGLNWMSPNPYFAGVSGPWNQADYEAMSAAMNSPGMDSFPGFGSPASQPVVFWSIPGLTYSNTMLAVSRSEDVVGSDGTRPFAVKEMSVLSMVGPQGVQRLVDKVKGEIIAGAPNLKDFNLGKAASALKGLLVGPVIPGVDINGPIKNAVARAAETIGQGGVPGTDAVRAALRGGWTN